MFSHNSPSLATRLAAARGKPSGFDYMRITLAVAVVIFHMATINFGAAAQHEIWTGPYRSLISLILPIFFALSGFLVAGSLQRSKTIFGFLALRVIRIFPALMVEVAISALILGPLVTSLTLSEYFSGKEFWHYLANMVGWIHYWLPGVFAQNPFPSIVNGQLWTVPYELECYVALAGFAILKLNRRRVLFLITVVALQITYILDQALLELPGTGVPGRVLVLAFLAGVCIYLYKDIIIMRRDFAAGCLLLSILSFFTPLGTSALAFPVAYLTVYLGTCNPVKAAFLQSGDYSYGVFLFGFPVQQTVAWLGPWTHHYTISFALTAPIIAAIAFLSWHGVEKHFLPLRVFIPVIERWFELMWPRAVGLFRLRAA